MEDRDSLDITQRSNISKVKSLQALFELKASQAGSQEKTSSKNQMARSDIPAPSPPQVNTASPPSKSPSKSPSKLDDKPTPSLQTELPIQCEAHLQTRKALISNKPLPEPDTIEIGVFDIEVETKNHHEDIYKLSSDHEQETTQQETTTEPAKTEINATNRKSIEKTPEISVKDTEFSSSPLRSQPQPLLHSPQSLPQSPTQIIFQPKIPQSLPQSPQSLPQSPQYFPQSPQSLRDSMGSTNSKSKIPISIIPKIPERRAPKPTLNKTQSESAKDKLWTFLDTLEKEQAMNVNPRADLSISDHTPSLTDHLHSSFSPKRSPLHNSVSHSYLTSNPARTGSYESTPSRVNIFPRNGRLSILSFQNLTPFFFLFITSQLYITKTVHRTKRGLLGKKPENLFRFFFQTKTREVKKISNKKQSRNKLKKSRKKFGKCQKVTSRKKVALNPFMFGKPVMNSRKF